jgi:N-acetylglucosamine PTS system EIICBA or EIICB component
MALTSFLTGVTEPIEFSFMFLAPVLYAIHAVLTGLALAVCSALGIHLGFTFSAGAIDYALNYGLSTKGWEAIPIGLAYAVIYYGLFRFFIRKFNMATPGREADNGDASQGASSAAAGGYAAPVAGAGLTRAQRYIAALGGAGNLTVVDACTTRLRLSVVDSEKVSDGELKAIGARGVLKRGSTNVQVIIGPEADIIADEIRTTIGQGAGAAGAANNGTAADTASAGAKAAAASSAAVQTAAAVASASASAAVSGPLDPDPLRWLAVFGGATNIASLQAVAATRLRIAVRDASAVDRQRLGVLDVAWVSPDTFHIVVGQAAQRYAQQLSARLPAIGGAAAQPA